MGLQLSCVLSRRRPCRELYCDRDVYILNVWPCSLHWHRLSSDTGGCTPFCSGFGQWWSNDGDSCSLCVWALSQTAAWIADAYFVFQRRELLWLARVSEWVIVVDLKQRFEVVPWSPIVAELCSDHLGVVVLNLVTRIWIGPRQPTLNHIQNNNNTHKSSSM